MAKMLTKKELKEFGLPANEHGQWEFEEPDAQQDREWIFRLLYIALTGSPQERIDASREILSEIPDFLNRD